MWETAGKLLDLLKNPTIIGAVLIFLLVVYIVPIAALIYTDKESTGQLVGVIRSENQMTRETIRTYFGSKKLVNQNEE